MSTFTQNLANYGPVMQCLQVMLFFSAGILARVTDSDKSDLKQQGYQMIR